ncbi:hypothetical protein M8J76_004169 [Diaphorina citri]|nr:hypothetical protein M8J76_004169 [Diaphorina citri]
MESPGFRLLISLLLQLIALGSCQQQYFRVVPKNTTVQEGGEVTLECEVSNLAGTVQWTKDGFALGFNSIIPGFPSYMRVGDSSHGVYNLRIRNVSLTDDAEFQCQVGPAQYHKPIRANARLTVIYNQEDKNGEPIPPFHQKQKREKKEEEEEKQKDKKEEEVEEEEEEQKNKKKEEEEEEEKEKVE